jgi:hypothetical protein
MRHIARSSFAREVGKTHWFPLYMCSCTAELGGMTTARVGS